jgi:ribosomal-protein-alanine N-acetyltransferase
MDVRFANPNDLDAIMVIEDEAHPIGIRESREIFLERIETYPQGFLVAVEEDKIVRYICSELWQTEKITSDLFTLNRVKHKPDGNIHYISSMAILQEAQSRGIGRALFKELLTMVEVPHRVLIVGINRPRAHRIYIDAGFEPKFAIKDFFNPKYVTPYSGLVMEV